MSTVTSRDGTRIAFDRIGDGPPVILVASALADRSDAAKLATALAERFSVINYDRRGRGLSGDTPPYAPDREIEDLGALVESLEAAPSVFGSSSGAVLALRAAAAGLPLHHLALYEPPLRCSNEDNRFTAEAAAAIRDFVAAGRHDDAVRYFMTKEVGVPGPLVRLMRFLPGMWGQLRRLAPTLPYDYAVMGDLVDGRRLSAGDWRSVTVPTLVLDGAKSPERFRAAADALAASLPAAARRSLDGQGHGAVMTAPKAIAAALTDFFDS